MLLKKSLQIYAAIAFAAMCSEIQADGWLPYISPGIRIGWEFKSGFTVSPKISIGLLKESFYNITIGIRFIPKWEGASFYTDFQTGFLYNISAINKDLFLGGGAGLIIKPTQTGVKIAPRTTLFSGWALFSTVDISYWSIKEILLDLGLQGVLPIPLKKYGSISFPADH